LISAPHGIFERSDHIQTGAGSVRRLGGREWSPFGCACHDLVSTNSDNLSESTVKQSAKVHAVRILLGHFSHVLLPAVQRIVAVIVAP